MKSIFITLLLILFVSCAKKEDADINKIVSDAYPNVSIESLKKIDENFHEIIINNQIYYATNDGKYLIVGSVIDLETKDDGINKGMGAGWATGKGKIVGFAVATEGWAGYYPIEHFGGGNLIKEQVLQLSLIHI